MSPISIMRKLAMVSLYIAVGCSGPIMAAQSVAASSIEQNSPGGFVFDANGARHSARPALLIRLSEIITRQELRIKGPECRGKASRACNATGFSIPSLVGKFSAMSGAEIHSELPCDPTNSFIVIGEQHVKRKLADVIQRVKSQLEEACRAVVAG